MNATIPKDTRDLRFTAIEKSATDTIKTAASEPYWQSACDDMYTACTDMTNMAATQDSDSAPVKQELADVARMAKGGSDFAHNQPSWSSAAVILYQTMADEKIAAHSSNGKPEDKFAILKDMLTQASQYAHRQPQWNTAAIVLYQAYRDAEKISEANLTGLTPEQNSTLKAIHTIATQTETDALRQSQWSGAANLMYAGIDSMSSLAATPA